MSGTVSLRRSAESPAQGSVTRDLSVAPHTRPRAVPPEGVPDEQSRCRDAARIWRRHGHCLRGDARGRDDHACAHREVVAHPILHELDHLPGRAGAALESKTQVTRAGRISSVTHPHRRVGDPDSRAQRIVDFRHITCGSLIATGVLTREQAQRCGDHRGDFPARPPTAPHPSKRLCSSLHLLPQQVRPSIQQPTFLLPRRFRCRGRLRRSGERSISMLRPMLPCGGLTSRAELLVDWLSFDRVWRASHLHRGLGAERALALVRCGFRHHRLPVASACARARRGAKRRDHASACAGARP